MLACHGNINNPKQNLKTNYSNRLLLCVSLSFQLLCLRTEKGMFRSHEYIYICFVANAHYFKLQLGKVFVKMPLCSVLAIEMYSALARHLCAVMY